MMARNVDMAISYLLSSKPISLSKGDTTISLFTGSSGDWISFHLSSLEMLIISF